MARDLRSLGTPILTSFAIISLCFGATLSHAKECTNVPTECVSHTLRARGIEKLTPEEAGGGKFITTLVSSFRKLLFLEGHGGEFELNEIQKDSSKVDSTSGDDPESGELLDIDDWGRTWVTITKPLIKYARKRAGVSKHDGEKLSSNDLGSLLHDGSSKSPSSILWTSKLSEENVSKPSFAAGLKQLNEVSLNMVSFTGETPHIAAQKTNLQYLLELDVDNLIWNFRQVANLKAPGHPYGGWESPQSELRGHFVGHYLSATALTWATTHNVALCEKMTYLINSLKECQKSIGTGYLSAFPSEFFDRFEAVRPVWAPYYTIHKIMAGLLDQYTVAKNKDALDMVVAMANYFNKRVNNVIEQFTIERHYRSLNEETGGMNDVLYRLYIVTGDEEHLKLAHLFDKPCFLGPLALEADHLSGFHANTHIPLIVGSQMRYEVTGDPIYRSIAEYFMAVVNSSHSYATGGTSVSEFWTWNMTDPMRLGDTLQTENQETCTTYNMLKVARTLFRWTKDIKYMDYYERTIFNSIMGIQRGEQPGVMLYMLPLGRGVSKARSYHGWGNKFDSFWCCYGTGVESFAKLGDSIYFEENNETPTLYVAQLVSSDIRWDAAGLSIRQIHNDITSHDPILVVTFLFSRNKSDANGDDAIVHVRIPSWFMDGCRAFMNGQAIEAPVPGEYFSLTRAWRTGDELSLALPLGLRFEKIQDDRSQYSALHAIMFGPFLMVGLGESFRHDRTLSQEVIGIPKTHNTQLFTFTQEGVTADGTSTTLSLAFVGGSATMILVPAEGTDQAQYATFRIAPPLTNISSRIGVGKGDNIVSVEVFREPGRYLVHNGQDAPISDIDCSSLLGHDPSPTFREPLLSMQNQSVFVLLPGLTGERDTVSFEAVSQPGCFLSLKFKDPLTTPGSVFLRCKTSSEDDVDDEAFGRLSTFRMHKGLASYHRHSFIVKGKLKNFVIAPLYTLRDETYTTYFEM